MQRGADRAAPSEAPDDLMVRDKPKPVAPEQAPAPVADPARHEAANAESSSERGGSFAADVYRATIDALFEALNVVDRSLRIVLINAPFLRWMQELGLDTDVIGRPIFEVFPFLPAHVRDEYRRAFELGETVVSEESTVVAGQRLHTETRKIPIRGADGTVARVMTVIRDTTALTRTMEALRRSEAGYRQLVEASPLGILVCQADRVAFCNRAAAELLGTPQAERLVGRVAADVLTPTIARALAERLERRDAGAPLQAFEQTIERLDGQPISLMVGATKLIYEGGDASQIVLQNITEQKRAEQLRRELDAQRQQSARLESLGALAGGIAHDFNNLLTSILGYVAMAQEGTCEQRARGDLDKAREAISSAVSLTRQLLTFAKGETPVRRRARLGQLVREATELALHDSPLDLRLALADERSVDVDPVQIAQVVQNLAVNAAQAMPQGGTFSVATTELERDGRFWIVTTFQDSGPGIPPETLERIFEPYFTTKQDGTGLGLAIAHSIVAKHGGTLTVQSRPGEGACFRLELPGASPGEPRDEPSHPEPSARPLRVLVMDDEQAVCRVLARLIGRVGHVVTTTATAREVVERYREALAAGAPFDVVLLDLSLQGGNGSGCTAADEIRKLAPAAKLVVASGRLDDPVLLRPADHGFAAALAKPFAADELLATLARVARPDGGP